MRTESNRVVAVLLLVCLPTVFVGGVTRGAVEAPERDVSLLLEGKSAVRRALGYLAEHQSENGSWRDHPAITALVVTAMVGSDEPEYGARSDVVTAGLDYIRSFARADGGIYDRYYAGYSTSICAMALVEAGLPEDEQILQHAREFLVGSQADEEEGLAPDDVQYGGWGYEKHASGEGMHRADVSNTQYAIEAIRSLEAVAEEDRATAGTGEGELTRTELAYDRAIVFLQRCQNLEATNDQPWASNDGGFVYRPGESKAGRTPEGGLRSYGGMTYAGLKSMIHARLSRDDPRVRAAYQWVRRHWTVEENPGLARQGLYYYYVTMARALNVYGVETITDAQGIAHDWRRELLAQLLRLQHADGSWVNPNGRWMESIPELVTAYAVLAIEHVSAGW